MTIDQMDVVDAIARDPDNDEVILFIFDHLPWTSNDQEHFNHLDLLQQKIYRYLDFIESGEMNERYPKAIGRNVRFQIRGKYEMDEDAAALFKKLQDYVSEQGCRLEFRYSPRE